MLYDNYIHYQKNLAVNVMSKLDPEYKNMNLSIFEKLIDDHDEQDRVDKVNLFFCELDKIPYVARITFIKDNEEGNDSMYDFLVHKLLHEEALLKKLTPCIVFQYCYCTLDNDSPFLAKLIDFKSLYEERKDMTRQSHMSIVEHISDGDLYEWSSDMFFDHIPEDKWIYIIFQVVFTLAVLQDKFRFNHNDLLPGNILLDSEIPKGNYMFKYGNDKFLLKDCSFFVKILDFEFSRVEEDFGLVQPFNMSKIAPEEVPEDVKEDMKAQEDMYKEFDLHQDLQCFLNSIILMDDVHPGTIPERIVKEIEKVYGEYLIRTVPDEGVDESPRSSYSTESSGLFSSSDTRLSGDHRTDEHFLCGQLRPDVGRKLGFPDPYDFLKSDLFKELRYQEGQRNICVDDVFGI